MTPREITIALSLALPFVVAATRDHVARSFEPRPAVLTEPDAVEELASARRHLAAARIALKQLTPRLEQHDDEDAPELAEYRWYRDYLPRAQQDVEVKAERLAALRSARPTALPLALGR